MNELAPFSVSISLPSLVIAAGDDTQARFVEFFSANIRNPYTLQAYGRAVADFLSWHMARHVPSISAVRPLHVTAWIGQQQRRHAAPTTVGGA